MLDTIRLAMKVEKKKAAVEIDLLSGPGRSVNHARVLFCDLVRFICVGDFLKCLWRLSARPTLSGVRAVPVQNVLDHNSDAVGDGLVIKVKGPIVQSGVLRAIGPANPQTEKGPPADRAY